MEKIEITLAFDGEKLDALEYALRKERTTVQKQMDEALRQLYEAKVPEAVRDYLDTVSYTHLDVYKRQRIHRRLRPVDEAGHRPVPDSLPPIYYPGGGTYGVQGPCPAGTGAYALRRRGPQDRRNLWAGHHHPGEYHERGLHRPGGNQHHQDDCWDSAKIGIGGYN